jgi:hypothetical protein
MQRADVLRLNRAWVDAGRGKPRPYTKFWNNLDTSLSREGSVEAGAPPGQPAGYAIYPITLQGANPAPFLVPARETSYRCHRIGRRPVRTENGRKNLVLRRAL